jgi:hypothetical protein
MEQTPTTLRQQGQEADIELDEFWIEPQKNVSTRSPQFATHTINHNLNCRED